MRRLGCLGLMLVLALIGVGFYVIHDWGGPGPAPHNLTVAIKAGSSMAEAADVLEKAGAIASANRFRLEARLFGGGKSIKSGEYRIPAHLSQSDLLKLLQGGRTLQRFVTIPEGWPAVMIADALNQAPELTGHVDPPAEGTVLPDSYSYMRGEPRADVLARMQAAMKLFLARAWARRKPGIAVDTPEDAVTLAAIVEKETGESDERRLVAAVYSNRLRQGMKLQADPTVIYPITRGRALGRRILKSELDTKNGYNTYTMTGLPKGPITNPGRAAIEAVMDPADSPALYFVADGTGGHVFANTLEEHNANVQKWYAIRRSRGEM